MSNHIKILQDRAQMLSNVRSFFSQRAVMEVDCPALSHRSSIDEHIEIMQVAFRSGQKAYLHSSAEYGMKRLLALGVGDIYQLSHVFRENEWGSLHNPEFMMIEWYRLNFCLQDMIEETVELISLFLGDLPSHQLTYRQAFKNYLGIDYLKVASSELFEISKSHNIHLSKEAPSWNKQTFLDLLMSFVIEPTLEKDKLTIITHYPIEQAALAKIEQIDDAQVALRFEICFQGTELANGFHELADPKDKKQRLYIQNKKRNAAGKDTLPIDQNFLNALELGLPDCCGVAVGFDRLMMLRHQKQNLAEVLSIPWENA